MDPVEKLLKQIQALNEAKKYQEVIDQLPDEFLEKYNNADLYAEKAQAYYRLSKNELCFASVDKALQINPDQAKAIFYKGIFYFDRKQYDKAIELYNKSIEVDPKNSHPYNGLGNAYYYLKQYDNAIVFYNKAIEADPKYSYPYNGLGSVYDELKQYDKAIEFYNKAIEADPKYSDPHNGLGNVYYELKQYDKAIEFYSKSIKTDPKYSHPYYGLGNVYYDLKQYDKAIEFLNKAIEIDQQYDSAYYNRALVYFETGQYKRSLADYKKYIDLTKDYPDYYTAIAKSRITELKNLIDNASYSNISELVNQIKKLLLFNDDCITHYTSLSVTKYLILESSLFRLSEGAYLNDTSEGRELFNFLSFHTIPHNGNSTIAEPFAQKPFIGSFVAENKHDDLTLWRMYGKEDKDEARGCAITLDRNKLLQNLKEKLTPDSISGTSLKTDEEYSFYKVAYRKQDKNCFIIPGAEEDEEKLLNEYMQDLAVKVKNYAAKKRKSADTQNVVELLNEIAYLFKSAEYQYEHEVRLVIKGIGFEKVIDVNFTRPKVYINLIPVGPVITKITLGPKVEKADEWASAFYYSLDKQDCHPEILISHLPFK